MDPRGGLFAALLLGLAAGGAWAQSLDVGAPLPLQEFPPGFQLTVRGNISGTPDTKVFLWVFNDDATTYPGGKCRSEEAAVVAGKFEKTFPGNLTERASGFTVVVQGLGPDGRYSDGQRTGDGKLFGTYERNLRCDDDKFSLVGTLLLGQRGNVINDLLAANSIRVGSDDAKVFRSVLFRVTTGAPTPAPTPSPTPLLPSPNLTATPSPNASAATPTPAPTPAPTPPSAPAVIIATPPPPPPSPVSPSPTPLPPPRSPSPTPRQPGFELLLAAGALGAVAALRPPRPPSFESR